MLSVIMSSELLLIVSIVLRFYAIIFMVLNFTQQGLPHHYFVYRMIIPWIINVFPKLQKDPQTKYSEITEVLETHAG